MYEIAARGTLYLVSSGNYLDIVRTIALKTTTREHLQGSRRRIRDAHVDFLRARSVVGQLDVQVRVVFRCYPVQWSEAGTRRDGENGRAFTLGEHFLRIVRSRRRERVRA